MTDAPQPERDDLLQRLGGAMLSVLDHDEMRAFSALLHNGNLKDFFAALLSLVRQIESTVSKGRSSNGHKEPAPEEPAPQLFGAPDDAAALRVWLERTTPTTEH